MDAVSGLVAEQVLIGAFSNLAGALTQLYLAEGIAI